MFTIQYIPKMEFHKVYKKVQSDRRERNVEYWGNVCSISVVDSDGENSVTRTNSEEVCTIYDARAKFKAPLLGPARRYGENCKGWKSFYNFKILQQLFNQQKSLMCQPQARWRKMKTTRVCTLSRKWMLLTYDKHLMLKFKCHSKLLLTTVPLMIVSVHQIMTRHFIRRYSSCAMKLKMWMEVTHRPGI